MKHTPVRNTPSEKKLRWKRFGFKTVGFPAATTPSSRKKWPPWPWGLPVLHPVLCSRGCLYPLSTANISQGRTAGRCCIQDPQESVAWILWRNTCLWVPQTAGTVKVSCSNAACSLAQWAHVGLSPTAVALWEVTARASCAQGGGKLLGVPRPDMARSPANEQRGLRNNQQLHLRATTLNFRARNKPFFCSAFCFKQQFFPQSSSPDNAAPRTASFPSGAHISHGSTALNTGRATMPLLSHTSGCTEGLL